MGQICAKLKNPDYSRQTEDSILSPFYQLDNIRFPEYPEGQLKFYRDLDDKFSVLNNILLSDYMTLLNNLSKSEFNAANGHQKNLRTDKITKNDWKKFCENKILKNPIVKKSTIQMENYQKQFFDDLGDDIRLFYAFQNRIEEIDEDLEIPKISFFSVGFNYCFQKISQKVIILLSLFTDSENKVSLSEDLYLFFVLIFSNVFRTPVRFLAKELGPDVSNESFLYSVNLVEADKVTKLNDTIIKGIIITLTGKVVSDLFGEEANKVYTREEFKKTLLDENFIWIFSNKGIKMKVEEELTRRNI